MPNEGRKVCILSNTLSSKARKRSSFRYGRDGGNQAIVTVAAGFGVLIMTKLGQLELAAILSGTGGVLTTWLMRGARYVSEYEDAVAGLRRDLGSLAFNAALVKGAAISYEQVALFFLSELARIRSSMGAA
jgi:hypothetical protein